MSGTDERGTRRTQRRPDATTVLARARLAGVSQAVLARVEADLGRAELPPLAHYDALLELRRAGAKGLRPFERQREMLLAQYNVSRLVDGHVRAGHVERWASGEDGRGQVLHLTVTGRGLLKRMWPIYANAIERHLPSACTAATTCRSAMASKLWRLASSSKE